MQLDKIFDLFETRLYSRDSARSKNLGGQVVMLFSRCPAAPSILPKSGGGAYIPHALPASAIPVFLVNWREGDYWRFSH